MMSRHTFSQEDTYSTYYTDQVQPELDKIDASFAQCWWMAKTAFFMFLYILGTFLYGAFHVGTVVVSLILSIASLLHAIFSGLKLLSKIALDWLKARPELQRLNVR